MNESDVSTKLREQMAADGAVCWKHSDRFHASRPDLSFIWKGITGYVEVKVKPNKPTALQTYTLVDIAAHEAPAYLLEYDKKDKTLALTDISAGTMTTFTNYKELSAWLLRQNCLNISKKLLS
jgi:hypothetical protein